ncbi:endo-1,3-alpha-glucanase family glycosylhydrolase [Dactylosporangium sp. NPDC005555]|uniref:endo-1,3-alpha-glucanase family glycosylhydrolase n=1 Tax=Dactylosporangium sp. NPDC005555 TaxID=3154889 RepID=UPI0033A43EFA
MRRLIALLVAGGLLGAGLPALPVPARVVTAARAAEPVTPLLAYYYAWFDPSSWNRAKIDYPTLGRYSSDDTSVMRRQIEWAKAAGINGFVVSWKDTETNNRRLRLLMQVAKAADFKLAMIYQGLDFSRKPLPASRVAADMAMFRDKFAPDPVFFRLNGKPLTMFSGSWEFSRDEVATVTAPVRKDMLVLSTEKSLEGYRRLADVTDGDAYYWSSVDPDTYGDHTPKLAEMSAAIHRDGKYWIAPFAPGFDARLVGGTRSVDRKNGETLRIQYSAAVRSSPDVLGLISWNEFSENTHVEPSQKYGTTALDVLRGLRTGAVPSAPVAALDSSAPGSTPLAAAPNGGRRHGPGLPNLPILAGFPVLLVTAVWLIAWLRRRRRPAPVRHHRSPTSKGTL